MENQNDKLREAIELSHKCMLSYGIPASVQIAQWILESAGGTKHMGDAHNYWGMKGTTKWGYVENLTKEYIPGKGMVTVKAKFRKYPNMTESFLDHAKLLADSPRYKGLGEIWRKQKPLDIVEAAQAYARGLQARGYATDPRYSDKLISLMNINHLYDYDDDTPGSDK